jgi:O-antigen ligase
LDYWRATFELIKIHPLTGVGLGNFNITFSRFAHNSFLQFWAETGLIGISALAWFIIKHFRILFINLKTTQNKNLAAAFLASNIVFLVHNLFDFTFFLPEACLIWWVILGLSINKNI